MTDQRFRLTADEAAALAREFGTPLYVLDEAGFRARIRAYVAAFGAQWPSIRVSYASKANSSPALLKIAYLEGLRVDVASEGELRAALFAGVPAHRCILHGNPKLYSTLSYAAQAGVQEIVADSLEELSTLAELGYKGAIQIRLNAAIAVETNAKIATSAIESKFGFSIEDGSAGFAIREADRLGLHVEGFHIHAGSQLLDPAGPRDAGLAMAKFAFPNNGGRQWTTLNLGGGRAARYVEEDVPPVDDYLEAWVAPIADYLRAVGVAPTLTQEPGRCLIAEAGVTLLQIQSVRRRGGTTFVAVNGGMFENPRPALYGASYQVESFADRQTVACTIVGAHCENDLLYPDSQIADPKPGDLLQVLTTGAYSSVMASNYNRFQRPATILRRESGEFRLIQRRETFDDLLARDVLPEGL